MHNILTELSILLVIGTLVAALMRFLRQPLIIGHIITGLLVGPYAFNILRSSEVLEVFAQMGIALLLFIVGLSLSPKVIREVGKVAVITGLGQIVFTSLIGVLISFGLGFALVPSLYISIGLTFSSTIIVLKLLSDKGDLGKLYSKISIGFLLVQDIIASLLLMGVSSLSGGEGILQLAIRSFVFGALLTILLVLVSLYVLPKISAIFAKSQEFLFLFTLGWGLGVASLVSYLGFSMEIGALVAGVTLSISPYQYDMTAKLRPVRDFFIILFFILLGSQLVVGNIAALFWPAFIFSLFVLVGNPLIIMVLMGVLGYKKKVSFFAGLTVAQISEFSLILAALGFKLGHVDQDIVSLLTVVGLVTIAGSTYLILYAEKIYIFLAPYLSIFERKKLAVSGFTNKHYPIILFGYNRVGYDFVLVFKKLKKRFLIVDFNPEVIQKLSLTKIPCIYGDADDTEFLEELRLSSVSMIVSTIPDFATNLLLVSTFRKTNKEGISIVISHSLQETDKLYACGATYVVMPHFLGAHYASSLIGRFVFDVQAFEKERQKHMQYLEHRKNMGHEHPVPESLR